MAVSLNNSTSYSAITSLGVHLIVVVFAGNYILLQDRLVPPPKKTYKLEVIKVNKPPLVKKKLIKKTVEQKVTQAVPLQPKVLPTHTPTPVVKVAQVTRDVPMKSAPMKSTPMKNTSTVSKQSIVQSSSASSSFRTTSVSPRSVQSVMVSNQSKTGRSVAVSTSAQSRTQSAPARKMTQATVTASFTSKAGSLLIQGDSQRITAPSFQARAIQSDGISQKVHEQIGTFQIQTSAVRVSSSAFGPRSVPNIVDPGLLRGYSRSIQSKIAARKKYPKKSKRKGEEGQVIIHFILLRSGKIKNLSLASATPYPDLNKAALDAVRRAAPFSSIPDAIGEEFLEFELPFSFKIER